MQLGGVLSAVRVRRKVADIQALRAVATTGGASAVAAGRNTTTQLNKLFATTEETPYHLLMFSVVPDAAAGAAAAALHALSRVDLFSVLAGRLLPPLRLACCSAPAGAQRRGRGCSFSAAFPALLIVLVWSLVHNDQLVLLPVAGLGVIGAF